MAAVSSLHRVPAAATRRPWLWLALLALPCAPRLCHAENYAFHLFGTAPTMGLFPTDVELADLNGDGLLDVLAVNSGASTLSRFLAYPGGGLNPATTYAAGVGAFSLAVGSLSEDGQPDVVVANRDEGTVSVFLGVSGGGFAASIPHAVGAYPVSAAVGDVTGDGHADVVVTNAGSNTISLLQGDGSGGLLSAVSISVGTYPYDVDLQDFNGDGLLDVAVANNLSDNVSILLSDGQGGLLAPTNYVTGAPTTAPTSVVGADIDSDGHADLVVNCVNGGFISILHNDGSGSFGHAMPYPTGAGAQEAIVHDFNDDGMPDLVTPNFYAYRTYTVLLNDGSGGFTERYDYAPAGTPYQTAPRAAAAGDMNGDGLADVVFANLHTHEVAIYCTGYFVAGALLPASGTDLFAIAIEDLNDDGLGDLVAAMGTRDSVEICLNDGAGGFIAGVTYSTGVSPAYLDLGDLDGDDVPDLVVGNAGSQTVSVRLGTGSGAFGPRTDFPTGDGPADVDLADFNEDQVLDLVVGNPTSGTVSIRLGDGSGGFGPAVAYATGAGPVEVATADFNQDGFLDLVTANSSAGTVSILLGLGTGAFEPRVDYDAPWSPNMIEAGDVSGDGHPDVVVSRGAVHEFSLLIGDGDGGLEPRLDYFEYAPRKLVLADFTQDGRSDAVFVHHNMIAFTAHAGSEVHGLAPMLQYRWQESLLLAAVATGELNGDGRPDLLITFRNEPWMRAWYGTVGLRISQQPQGQALCAGQDLVLTVGTSGASPSYQWRRNGVNLVDGGAISGSGSSTLTVSQVFPQDAGTYDVVVSYPTRTVVSNPAPVSVCDWPTFLSAPTSQVREMATSAGFKVVFDPGCDDVVLEWLKDGQPIGSHPRFSGVDTDSLTVSGLMTDDTGFYSVRATNSCGSQVSAPHYLEVVPCIEPPGIVTEPADLVVPPGNPATFTMLPQACTKPLVQWLKNGVPIPGANDFHYTIPSVTSGDAGFYRAFVSVGKLSALTRNASLNLVQPVFISQTHRIVSTSLCNRQAEIGWESNVSATFTVQYQFTASPTFPVSLGSTVVVGPSTTGLVQLAIPTGPSFLCYRIVGQDAGNQVFASADRILTLPNSPSFSLGSIIPSIVASPTRGTLYAPGDAVAVGVAVRNANCSPLGARLVVDQARLNTAPPRTPEGSPALPRTVAVGIGAQSSVRMPGDFLFHEGDLNLESGVVARFRGRLLIQTSPSARIPFIGNVSVP